MLDSYPITGLEFIGPGRLDDAATKTKLTAAMHRIAKERALARFLQARLHISRRPLYGAFVRRG